jgi:alkanesulfonate monooxygenase SsuD/methylene tetrahydromethanopterin reductase-like flavin-dependent oxidoreductase (luciferase family)
MTKFGVVVPQHEASREELFEAALMAEEAGLDSIWVADHVWGRPDPNRPILEGWTALAAVAAMTERITIGPFVGRVALRLPRVTAAMAETLERIAPARTIIGLGIGDHTIKAEQKAYGLPFPSKIERLALLDETIDSIGEVSPSTAIWIGGTTNELVDRAPRADGFNFWVEPEEFGPLVQRLKTRQLSKRFEISWAGNNPTPESIRLLTENGADHLVVPVGVKNYKERIARLADERSRLA